MVVIFILRERTPGCNYLPSCHSEELSDEESPKLWPKRGPLYQNLGDSSLAALVQNDMVGSYPRIMKLKSSILLYFIMILSLIIIGGRQLGLTQSSDDGTGNALQQTITGDKVEDRFLNQTMRDNDWQNLMAVNQQMSYPPTYGPATTLLEDVGGSIVDLLPAYASINDSFENGFGSFEIYKEGDIYYLWLNSRVRVETLCNVFSIEQRFESQDGLLWRNRTDTNLVRNTSSCRLVWGLREIIKNGNVYEGWEEYY